MRLGGYVFRPRLIPTLATLVTFPILLSLGFWQLDRAQQKAQAQAAFEARTEAAPLDLNESMPDPSRDTLRQVRGRGRYEQAHQFLLDNQTHNSQVGYHVLTPFQLNNTERAILVDRGWVQGGIDRSTLPEVAVPSGEKEITGHVDQGPVTGLRLGDMSEGDSGWPLRVQYVDLEAMSAQLGYPLQPMVVRLDAQAEGGFVREWQPGQPNGFGPARNRGYAVQWFGLAATLAIIFVVVNLKRRADNGHDETDT